MGEKDAVKTPSRGEKGAVKTPTRGEGRNKREEKEGGFKVL